MTASGIIFLSRYAVLPNAMDTQSPDGAEPHEQFEDQDDFQIMEWLSVCKDSDPQMARAAWACLYYRHAAWLLRRMKMRTYDEFGNDAAAEDLTAHTFQKVYEKAETFKPDSTPPDTDGKKYVVMAWIGRIAENLIRDVQRDLEKFEADVIAPDHWAELNADLAVSDHSTDTLRVRQAMLEVLDEREQDILRTTYHYYDPATKCPPKLPSDQVKRLCQEHGITPENLRQIRRRAFAKLSDALMAARKAG